MTPLRPMAPPVAPPTPQAAAPTVDIHDTYAGGARIEFTPGDVPVRDVMINGGFRLSLQKGAPLQTQMWGQMKIDAQDGQLWINDQHVDFTGRAAQQTPEELVARFPGVTFYGDPKGITIGQHVQIEPGATIELTPGMRLDGHTTIRNGAHLSGGTVVDSDVQGRVVGGRLFKSKVEYGAVVQDGELMSAHVKQGARVSGGLLNGVTLEAGASVSGRPRLQNVILQAGAVVTGGDLSNLTLAAGQQIEGGTHTGQAQGSGNNQMLTMAAMMFMPGLAPLLMMPGGQQMLGNAASGFSGLGKLFGGR